MVRYIIAFNWRKSAYKFNEYRIAQVKSFYYLPERKSSYWKMWKYGSLRAWSENRCGVKG